MKSTFRACFLISIFVVAAVSFSYDGDQTERVRDLVVRLKSSDLGAKAEAANALSGMRRTDRIAVPMLIEALGDSDGSVRGYVALALKGIGPEARSAVPTLTNALKDSDLRVRRNAALALVDIDPAAAKPAVLVLKNSLKETDEDVRKDVINALGLLGAFAKIAVPDLTLLLGTSLNIQAAESLAKIGDTKKSVPLLINYLKQGRETAAWALARVGPGAKDAVPALKQALDTKDLRILAGYALANLGDLETAMPVLLSALKDEDWLKRSLAASVLGKIKPKPLWAITALTETLGDSDMYVREAAASSLGDIGPDAKTSVPGLVTALKDSEWLVRCVSARALGYIGPSAAAAVSNLGKALNDKEEAVRKEAELALELIQNE